MTKPLPPTSEPADHIDHLVAQWRRELPDLDTEPMTVLGRIHRVAHLVTEPIVASFQAFGLGRGEFDVLGTLLRSGPPYCLTPTELYRTLMISSGGLTDRLRRLQHARLVTRDAAPDDARSLRVRLTQTGKQTAEASFRADMALEASLLAGLSRDERRALAGLLRKLAASMERLREPG